MYHKIITILFICACPLILISQTTSDSLEEKSLPTFFITESKPSFITTSRNIVSLTHSDMKEIGGQTLSDALSHLPGVSQLTTGPISKPVIRGLYGNRLQMNVGGLRLEDQQWEDEHGLGLSEVGVARVELIKGAAALLFGSDAMGGVINIIEEKVDSLDGQNRHFNYNKMQNLNVELFSNTLGVGVDYGFKQKTTHKNELILRGGVESHADYSDGNGNRAPNTRFAMYNFKAGYIIHKPRWTSENRFHTTYNQFAFIKDSSEINDIATEERWAREFDDEHHNVLYNILSSRNTIKIDEKTTWKATLGAQSNLRQEQEGEEETELNLLLNTISINTSIEKQLLDHVLWINGVAGMYQTNTNYGTRTVVPDAKIAEGAVFSYIKKAWYGDQITTHIETGLRYDRRNIHTFVTEELNNANSGMSAFNRAYDALNGAIGLSLLYKNWVFKTDLATGFRPANLAELSSNGLHEGTNRWDLGLPNLKTERCRNIDMSAQYQKNAWILRGGIFQNNFQNYIFIAPTNELFQNVPLFRYQQTNAVFKGFETGLEWKDKAIGQVSIDYSFLNARATDGSWLPFTPANRLLGKAKWYVPTSNRFHNTYLSFNATYTAAQNHISTYETGSPQYWLFSMGAGTVYKKMRFTLTCTNLTNKIYNNHLSRLRYVGIRDMGRNVVLNWGIQF
jgi:iron complex outermembrane recepter protein